MSLTCSNSMLKSELKINLVLNKIKRWMNCTNQNNNLLFKFLVFFKNSDLLFLKFLNSEFIII